METRLPSSRPRRLYSNSRSFRLALALLGAGVLPVVDAGAAWLYETEILVTSTKNDPATNFQVLVELNPGNFDYSHANVDGSDLRFTTTSGSETFDVTHFIETWVPGGTSRIWAKVASVPALSTMSLYLRHGNPAAATSSDFAGTFPNAFISTGANTLGGVQSYDWFEIQSGHTVTVTAGAPLVVTARKAILVGTVNANGAGHAAVAIDTSGNGPGAGTTSPSSNSGAGGGSYGGVGGAGGFDSGETPGTGGAIYGTETGTDIAMGSGGGAGSIAGASGGGAVSITAQDLLVSGSIFANGNSPGSGLTARGSGGGSGGGIALFGYNLSFSGTLSAMGGNGTAGTNAANDSGGGGGGGRIKLFAEGSLEDTGAKSALGGTGGPNGTAAPGQDGGAGTIYSDTTTVDFEEILAEVGSESIIEPGIQLSTLRRFPRTEVGVRSRAQTLTITNSGKAPLTSIATQVTGSATREFRVGIPLTTLAPGNSTKIGITFKPKRRGPRKATLTVSGNSPGQSVNLRGTGFFPVGRTVGPPKP